MRTKPRNPWYTQALKKLKRLKLAKRHLECIWPRTHSSEDLKHFRKYQYTSSSLFFACFYLLMTL